MRLTPCPSPLCRAWAVRLAHASAILLSLLLACLLHNGTRFPAAIVLVSLASKVVVFELFRLHRQLWRTFGSRDVVMYAAANAAASMAAVTVHSVSATASLAPGIWVTDLLLCQTLMTAASLSFRFRHQWLHTEDSQVRRKKVLIYGAGRTGRVVLREADLLRGQPYQIVGFVDDDPSLAQADVETIPVLGTGYDLTRLISLHEIEEVLVTVPRASLQERTAIVEGLAASGAVTRVLPSLGDLIEGRAPLSQATGEGESTPDAVAIRETLDGRKPPSGRLAGAVPQVEDASETSVSQSLLCLAGVHGSTPANPEPLRRNQPASSKAEEQTDS